MRKFTLASFSVLLLGLLALPTQLGAQGVTSSALGGSVTDAGGKPVVGAEITAVDTSSGTRYSSVTRDGGRWDIANVKTGGPYRITASADGVTKSKSGVFTTLSQTAEVNLQLSGPAAKTTTTTTADTSGAETERVVVSANTVDDLYSTDRNGTSTYVDRTEINNLPTITRSLNDYIRLTPQISTLGRQGASAAGQNNRSNNIQVDGASISDAFGLATSGGGTGAPTESAEPISLDAIDQFRVNIAPFDVRESNFAGASINAITRSGDNTFHGSAYAYGRNQDLVGEGSRIRMPVAAFHEYTYGARLSGPIFKDNLFFFASYEAKRALIPIIGDTSRFPLASVQRIIDDTNTLYGFAPGGTGTESTIIEDDKFLIKLDWNILTGHHATVTYNHVDGTNQFGLARGTTFDLKSRQYTKPILFDSTTFQLFDTWTPSFSTETRFVFNNTNAERVPNGIFPQVIVHETFGDVRFGSEQFSQENTLKQEQIEATFNATYTRGNHEFLIGTQNELLAFENKFLRDFFGSYDFRAAGGFTATQNYERGAPSNYAVTFPTVPGTIPITEVRLFDFSGYLQDKWKIRPNLLLTAGFRIDTHVYPDDPLHNPLFATRFPGRDTSSIDGDVIYSPRIGFNWDVFDNKKTQVRGGTGIFGTRTLGVLYTNQYGGTGVDFKRVSQNFGGAGQPALTPGFFTGNSANPPPPPAGTTLAPEIDITDKNFETPSSWRNSLALDQKLPFNLIATVEGLYTKTLRAVTERNINLAGQIGTRAEDGRPIFGGLNQDKSFDRVILLANSNSGYSYNLTAQLERTDPGDGWYSKVAYTYGRSYDVNSTTSSQASSNFGFNPVAGNPNIDTLSISDFELRHRVLAVVTYTHAFWKGWDTTIGAIYEGASGHPYSVLYNGDANGDGQFSNDLVYVPTGLNDPMGAKFLGGPGGTAWFAYNDYITHNNFLRNYRGQIAPRNGGRDPWINRLDLHFSQKIPQLPFLKWINAELTADILNFTNML
ncbi:MAG: carboxypeptidase regulatory-like domain-containing protein, partial [Verrucomicrobiota bacterium]|nr:carboxypeptidase regulatory-like domain-containing protein [Verrucomicrobiota bacterium]